MASKVIQRLTETAERLYELRKAISAKEEESKKELEAMKAERDAIQTLLLEDLNKQGLASIKVKNGDSFTRSVRKGIEITDELQALKWSMQNYAVSINKVLVAQKLKDATEIPHGFKFVETAFISVRKAKNNE